MPKLPQPERTIALKLVIEAYNQSLKGRPTDYSDEIAQYLCHRISEGAAVRELCRDPCMPHVGTIFEWLHKHPYFAELYAQAKRNQAEWLADECVLLADEAKGRNMADVTAYRLMIDTRKWVASKLLPRIYGDKLQVETTGSQIHIISLSPEDRARIVEGRVIEQVKVEEVDNAEEK